MADRKIAYAAAADVTITIASLATSSTLVAGRESNAVDNSTNKYLDYLVSGYVTTGTSPTSGKTIEVWVVAEQDDSVYPDLFDGTDSNETVTSRDILVGVGRLLWSITIDGTSDRSYFIPKTGVAQFFGGPCPRKFVFFVVHDTGVNLNATGGNQLIKVQGIYETIV